MLAKVGYSIGFMVCFAGAVHAAGLGAWQLWVFLVMPDLALLYGMAPGLAKGRLHPRAVRHYNLLHQPFLPALMCLAALLLLGGGPWLAGGLGWGAHIAIDRAVGYGLRTPEGWQRAT